MHRSLVLFGQVSTVALCGGGGQVGLAGLLRLCIYLLGLFVQEKSNKFRVLSANKIDFPTDFAAEPTATRQRVNNNITKETLFSMMLSIAPPLLVTKCPLSSSWLIYGHCIMVLHHSTVWVEVRRAILSSFV